MSNPWTNGRQGVPSIVILVSLVVHANPARLRAPRKHVRSKIALWKRRNEVPPAVKPLSSPASGAVDPLAYDRFQCRFGISGWHATEGPDTESVASDQFQNRERATRHRAVHIILSLLCGEQDRHNWASCITARAVTVPPGYRRTYPHPEIFGNLVPSLP